MKPFKLFTLLALLITFFSSVGSPMAQQSALPPEVIAYADMILYNGKILTADDKFSVAEAAAIRDGKFLAVGQNDRIRLMAGPRTQQIDLQGRSVVPGLIDTHLHQVWIGQISKAGSPLPLKDLKSGLEEIKKVVERAAPGEWVYFYAPDNAVLFEQINRKVLDSIAPKNPLVICSLCNVGQANSLALKTIPQQTGGLVKDPNTGEPTGMVSGFALGVLLYDMRPEPPITEEDIQLQKKIFKRVNSQGLTTIVGQAQGLSVSYLKALWERGELTARVRLGHELVRQNPNAEAYLKRVGNLSGFGDSMMKIHGTTVQPVDCTSSSGDMLTWKAKIREATGSPYGLYGSNHWVSYGSDHENSEWQNVILANRYGWAITSVHTQGDKAASVMLDAFEKANSEKPLQGRWGFDHALTRNADDIKRATKLGVIYSVAPKYVFQDPTSLVYQYGADQVSGMTPVRTMIDLGMKPVMEGDISGEWSAPLWLMEVLITRKDAKTGRVWGADQKITRQEALWMKTNWAARYSGDEKNLGTIEANKLADLVVIGGDYMTVPEDQIAELPIDLTIVGGKEVYNRSKEGLIRLPRWDEGRR
ncbi:MAG: amidohydrolase family protein [Acidobacteria bacterium]|nr:amidohydrolase family protein [Acidobacteriota bacterium]